MPDSVRGQSHSILASGNTVSVATISWKVSKSPSRPMKATLQRFSIEHLNKDLLVSLGGQVIAEMKLRGILEPGPMDTLNWRHVGREDIGTLAQRLP